MLKELVEFDQRQRKYNERILLPRSSEVLFIIGNFLDKIKLNPNAVLCIEDSSFFDERKLLCLLFFIYSKGKESFNIPLTSPMRQNTKLNELTSLLSKKNIIVGGFLPLDIIPPVITIIDRSRFDDVLNRNCFDLIKEKNCFYTLLTLLRKFPIGVRSFNNDRRKDSGSKRKQIGFIDEYDFQDYLRLVLYSHFDGIREETIPKRADDSTGGRVDFFIPECYTMVECKFVDNKGKKRTVEESIQSIQQKYSSYSYLKYLIFAIWDEKKVYSNPDQYERENSKRLTINNKTVYTITLILKL